MSIDKIVIVGAGQGGFQMAASLRQNKFTGQITLIGDEAGLPYQRPPLSKAYLKDAKADRLLLRPATFYERKDITLIDKTFIASINRSSQLIETADDKQHSYDHLVLATGARNLIPPIQNLSLKNVCALRTLQDAMQVRRQMHHASHIIVVGGGFIGLEFAAVARAAGHSVTLVEGAPRLMARAVSPPISERFKVAHENMGTTLVLDQFAVTILDDGAGNAAGLRLADGQEIQGDMVLIAAGVVPNVELAAGAGLAVMNGIIVDEYLRTSDAAISALGDCAAFPDPRTGKLIRLESVQAATDHARCISKRLMGDPSPYSAVPWFWSDQGDLKLQIAGLNTDADRFEVDDNADGGMIVYNYKGEALLAVESINSPASHMDARRRLAKLE